MKKRQNSTAYAVLLRQNALFSQHYVEYFDIGRMHPLAAYTPDASDGAVHIVLNDALLGLESIFFMESHQEAQDPRVD